MVVGSGAVSSHFETEARLRMSKAGGLGNRPMAIFCNDP